MRKILIFTIIFNSLLLASDNGSNNNKRENRVEKQIQIEIEKEKKYSKEQTFYQIKNYDLKSAEVNLDSLLTLPDIEEDDSDTDMLEMD